jgi:hypothetical protein
MSCHIPQVAIGEAVSSSIAHYLAAQEAAGGVSCNVITVPEECGTADALRLVAKHITAETLVVYSGDILTDLPVNALLATHQVGPCFLVPWWHGRQLTVRSWDAHNLQLTVQAAHMHSCCCCCCCHRPSPLQQQQQQQQSWAA